MTPEQLKRKFAQEGRTFSDWAKQHGFDRRDVYLVLNGQNKARWGKGHDIAVKLGLKSKSAA
jgi:gp16 family phage-associated protein